MYAPLLRLSLESIFLDGKKNAFFSPFSSPRLFLARAFRFCCTFLDATGSHIAIEKRALKRVCGCAKRYYRDDKLYIYEYNNSTFSLPVNSNDPTNEEEKSSMEKYCFIN